jgi:hypothetical protein
MAHDFAIRNIKKKESSWFFGYANGLMYRAFGDQKHDAGVSGDNGREIKSKAETEKALDIAIKNFDAMHYPDPHRLDDIKKFRQNMVNDDPADTYEVWYS